MNERTTLPLHPDDLLFFLEVKRAMQLVAKQYELPLRSVDAMTMPTTGMADRLGQCSSTGDIKLVMRATVDGKFVDAPRTPEKVWRTAAHELAHLRHFNHGVQFQEFQDELEVALGHRRADHRQKVIDRLVKMQASREGEAQLGNAEAAEAFASAINRMLIDYELSPSDLDYARATDHDPVIELMVDMSKYQIDAKKVRIAWQESLARIVARAHLCTHLISKGNNRIWFVGTNSHATVAEYVFGTLVPATEKMAWSAYDNYWKELRQTGRPVTLARGFRGAWLDAFVTRIAERFDEARKAAVAAVPAESTSTALMRLDGALVKVRQYIDDKFKGRKGHAHALNGGRRHHMDGRARGRAAADSVVLGRRGVTGGRSPKGLIDK